MIFRLTQKLTAKIHAGPLRPRPLDENPCADWSAHLFTADRIQYILLSHTPSLYSTVIYGKGITDNNQFINRALDAIRQFMHDDGQAFAYHRFVAPATATVCFAKALNRSVTGSMNELVYQAAMWLIEGDLSPYDVSFKLNEIPMSSLPAPFGPTYGTPRDAFKLLLVPPRTTTEP